MKTEVSWLLYWLLTVAGHGFVPESKRARFKRRRESCSDQYRQNMGVRPCVTPALQLAKRDKAEGNNLNDPSPHSDESKRRTKEEEDAILSYAIDSFIRGDYNLQLPAEEAENVLPPPDLGPGAIVSSALHFLRGKDLPSQTHGAAVFMRFCVPLRRSERWGDASSRGKDPWKEVLRGALTPKILLRRVRNSHFAALLDWNRIDVTEGAFTADRDLVYHLPSIAYVNAALYFREDSEPCLFQFKLRRVGGAWMIDSIRRSQKELFLETDQSGMGS